MIEWTDNNGQRAVLHDDGRISITGAPSMTTDDGLRVAIGVTPATGAVREVLQSLANDPTATVLALRHVSRADYRAALERIANMDYRGNRSQEQTIAYRALQDHKETA